MIEQAKAVSETERDEAAKGFAFLFTHQNLALPGFGVVYVAVFRGDVVVAQNGYARVAFRLLRQPAVKCRQPV